MQGSRSKRFKQAFDTEIQNKLKNTFQDKALDLFARDGTDEKGINVKDNAGLQDVIRKIAGSYMALFYEAQTHNQMLDKDQQAHEEQYNRWVYQRYTRLAFQQLKAAVSVRDANVTDKMVIGLYGSVIHRTCETFNTVFPQMKLPMPCITGSAIVMPDQFRIPRFTRDSFESRQL